MTTKTPSQSGASNRCRVFRIIDIVASALISLVGLLLMLILITLPGFIDSLFVQPFNAVVKILTVVGWFGGTAMFILFATRRRVTFYWPIVGIFAILLFFNLLAFIEGQVLA